MFKFVINVRKKDSYRTMTLTLTNGNKFSQFR